MRNPNNTTTTGGAAAASLFHQHRAAGEGGAGGGGMHVGLVAYRGSCSGAESAAGVGCGRDGRRRWIAVADGGSHATIKGGQVMNWYLTRELAPTG